MSTKNLTDLFRPESVAVIGASNKAGRLGNLVMHNLLEGGFDGPIMPVNPKRQAVVGVLAYPDVDALPVVPDLAIICTPPASIPDLIDNLGERGTGAAIVLTAGLHRTETNDGISVKEATLAAARKSGLRILGPNCLGLIVPSIRLNASFAHAQAHLGKIAFASQSGAMCTAVLDWAREHEIGFSHFISLGDCADVDFGDTVDFLATDPGTSAILLYIEAIRDGRKFMSACRAAARNKPVLAIKSGRVAEGAEAAASHTGALAGSDNVYEAAIRRAGMLRVDDIDELFAAAETLARAKRMRGERLAVMTNGGGIGVMAVDRLIAEGGRLADLAPDTLDKLDDVLPETWSRANPVDIIGDAPGSRYSDALVILGEAKEVDAVLVMHAPTATASSTEAANAVIDAPRGLKANVLTSWVGGEAVEPARKLFRDAGLPTYDTPGQAVAAFMHMIVYQRNQETLMETPLSAPEEFTPSVSAARMIIDSQIANGSDMLSEPHAKAVLDAYDIPVVETLIVRSPEEAAAKAIDIGFPVALKILAGGISHKSDVGGVVLDLENADSVKTAAEQVLKRVAKRAPDAEVHGFSIQQMVERPGAHESIVGIKVDPVFGPVILFGHGGTAVEVIEDHAVALPPLNMNLARDMISRTRISKLLAGYRDRAPANVDRLSLALMQIAQIAIDIPEIAELDINPLLVDEHGVLALDARIRIAPLPGDPSRRLAIRPYPKELEENFTLDDGKSVLLRPIRPEDEADHYAFLTRLTPEDARFRFFGLVGELPHSQMARLTQIDYDREMAFIARASGEDGKPETLGVVRTVTDADNQAAEFAIVIRSDLKGHGLGWKLFEKMIAYCRNRGTREMIGQVLSDNTTMLKFVDQWGFERHRMPDEPIYEVRMKL